MKSLVFDSSSIISLATNDLLWTLRPLRLLFNGNFYIPESVKHELVDTPLHSHRFKLEAIMVSTLIRENDLLVQEHLEVERLLSSINTIFSSRGQTIKIVSKAEVEALALALKLEAAAYVVDERTMRLLVENPIKLHTILESKLHTNIEINHYILKQFKEYIKKLKIIRSAELMMITLEKGLLNRFITEENGKLELADALLWSLRLRGCAISTEEIDELKKIYS